MHTSIVPLLEHVFARALTAPFQPAFISAQRTTTWQDFAALIRSGAQILLDAGVRRGDKIIIKGPNCLEWAVCYFAAHAAGAIAVPVETEARVDTLEHVRARTGAKLVVTSSSSISLSHFSAPFNVGGVVAKEGLAQLRPDDVADILFTTGTTAAPKGVVLSHANIAHAARNTSAFLGQRADDIELVPIPLSHSFGLGRLRCAALVGTALVLEAGLKNPLAVLQALEKSRATGLALVPAGFALLRRLTKDRLGQAGRHLRYVEIGSAALQADVRDWLIASLPGVRLCHHYGMTEASRAAFVELGTEAGRGGSIGRASPNVVLTIRDDQGNVLPRGAEGEIWVEGGMVVGAYLDDASLTRANIVAGRIRTGDLGAESSDGFFYLKGRRSDVINVGGLKVAPTEIESLLNEYEGIAESACVACPDEIAGERVVAFYVAEASVDHQALGVWLRERGLEPHKVPARFERISALPKTSSGKLLRRTLRATVSG
jgi:long-chain acyl-CoA synthetase